MAEFLFCYKMKAGKPEIRIQPHSNLPEFLHRTLGNDYIEVPHNKEMEISLAFRTSYTSVISV